jgi:hypothetical protein
MDNSWRNIDNRVARHRNNDGGCRIGQCVYGWCVMTWIDVKDGLPEKTDAFFVTRKVQTYPILATFVHLTQKWMVNICGQIWEIKDVQFYMEPPEHPTRKERKL